MTKRNCVPSEHGAGAEQRPTDRRTYLRRLGTVAALGVGSLAAVDSAGAAESLPRELTVRGASANPGEYTLSVSDTVELGELADASEDRIEGTTASGTVGSRDGGDVDTYRFAGDLLSITDDETFRFDINPDAGRLTIASLGSSSEALRYAFSVDGTLRAVETGPEDSVFWYLGFGAVGENPDVYAYTGEFEQLIAGPIDVTTTT